MLIQQKLTKLISVVYVASDWNNSVRRTFKKPNDNSSKVLYLESKIET